MSDLFKFFLILALGFIMGYQFSSGGKVLSKIEVSALPQSEANQELDKILAERGTKSEKCDSRKSPSITAQSLSPTKIKLEELENQPLNILAQAFDRKRKSFLNENIKKYQAPESQEELEKSKEVLQEKIYSAVEASYDWMSQTELEIAGEVMSLVITVKFYEPPKYAIGDMSESISSDMCWITNLFVDFKQEKIRYSTSSCLEPFVKDGTYFMQLDVTSSKINNFIYYILIPFPLSNSQLEYFTSDKKWLKSSGLSWTAISYEEAQRQLDNHEYQWDYY